MAAWRTLISTGITIAAPNGTPAAACAAVIAIAAGILIRVAHLIGAESDRDGGTDECRRRKVRCTFASVLDLPAPQCARAASARAVDLKVRSLLVCHFLST